MHQIEDLFRNLLKVAPNTFLPGDIYADVLVELNDSRGPCFGNSPTCSVFDFQCTIITAMSKLQEMKDPAVLQRVHAKV